MRVLSVLEGEVYRHKVTGMPIVVAEFRLECKPYPWYVCTCIKRFDGRPHCHRSSSDGADYLVEEGDFMLENPAGVLKRAWFLDLYEKEVGKPLIKKAESRKTPKPWKRRPKKSDK